MRALPKTGETRPPGSVAVPRPGLGGLMRESYLRVIILLAFFGVLAKYLVDFAFLAQMRTRYADAQNLATFFALFSGFSQVASLLTRVFVSGRLLSRFGVRAGLTVLPAAHVACTALIVASGLLPGGAGLVFWLVISNQAIYKTLKHPIDNPSFKVLYQPCAGPAPGRADHSETSSRLTIGLAGGLCCFPGSCRSIGDLRLVDAGRLRRLGGDGWPGTRGGARAPLKRRFTDDDEPFS